MKSEPLVRGTGATSSAATEEALWLETLGRLASRVAHELKGALNGVVVNLEVVRTRASRPDSPASAVASFAESAGLQLEGVITMSEALLWLARPAREPVELGHVVRRIAALVAPAAKADDRSLEIDGLIDALGTTSASGLTVRLIVASALMAAIDESAQVVCRGIPGGESPTLCIESPDGGSAVALPPEVVTAARDASIQLSSGQSGISIIFPP